jgi:hypothetical protein
MPSESSSVVTNATNGIEPRSLITTKLNKTGGIKMVVLLNHWVINIH